MLYYHILIVVLGVAGASLASYIYGKKRQGKVLICPIKADCDTVVHGEFSFFFGIPVEIIGILYYAVVSVGYLFYIFAPAIMVPVVALGLVVMTTGAFLFSIYLTFLQAFTIRQWCSWCLISAGMSTLIFVLALVSLSTDLIPILASTKLLIVGLHLIGFALGIGGATIADILFLRFLRDFVISRKEADILRTISQLLWVALAVLVLSGIGLYLPEAARLNESSKFLVKMTVVGVLVVNAAWLNLYLSPRLVTLSFGRKTHPGGDNVPRLRRIAFALGALSITSWYTAFVLGLLESVPLNYWSLLGVYVGIVLVGVISSQVLLAWLERKALSRVKS